MTLYVQFLGLSAFEAGLLSLPGSLMMILLAARVGVLADRRGPRLFLTGGPALMGLAILLFLPVDERSDVWVLGIPGLVLFSLGLAALVAPITATALRAAPKELAGIASGVNTTVSRLGSLTAVAAIGVAVTLVFHGAADAADAVPLAKDQEGEELRAASIAAFRVAMLISAALVFAGAVLAALGISDEEAKAADAEPATSPAAAPAER